MGTVRRVGVAIVPSAALLAAAWLLAPALPNAVNWYVIRSAGLVAFGLLTLTTAMGLSLALRMSPPGFLKIDVLDLHRGMTQLAFAFLALHLGALLGDRFLAFGLPAIVGATFGPYRPVPVWLGSAAAWLLVVTTAAFAWRRSLGARPWRMAHRVAYAAWLIALIHGVAAGSDTSFPATQWFYLTAGLAVTGLLIFRLLWRSREASTPRLNATPSELPMEERRPMHPAA